MPGRVDLKRPSRGLPIPCVRSLTTSATALALLLCFGGAAVAQAPQGYLACVYPAGGQQGQTVTLTAYGSDLDGAKGVRVSGGGVSGEVVEVKKEKSDVRVTVKLSLAKDAEPGIRDFRLTTSGGVTNRRRFIVGTLPEIVEKEPNSELAEAQPMPDLPAVANGQIFGADKDAFRFKAKKGQTIVCRIDAQRLIPYIADGVPGWFQAVLTLRDAEGNKVAYVDDFRHHPDPVLVFDVPEDGEYVAELRDSVYRGREDFVYRLSIGEISHITRIEPLGGKLDAPAKVDLFGPNLPKEEVELPPADAGRLTRQVSLSEPPAPSNTMPFAVSTTPETAEAEPNNSRKNANAIAPPITVNGHIDEPGDLDCFAVDAKAKQVLVIDVHARRLESPMDSIVKVFDPSGKEVATADDTEDITRPDMTHHADSTLTYKFAKAGRHVVQLGDIQGKGGREFAYRLSIAPPRPDYQLRVTPDNPRLGQGATTIVTVHAIRLDGFKGPIEIAATDLPAGFEISGTTIAEGEDNVILSLTAPEDAPLGIHTPKLVGKATIGGKEVVRDAVPVEDVMQAFYYHHLLPTDEFLLSVVEPGPYKLIPEMPDGYIRFASGRTAFCTIKVERKPEAKGAIRLTLQNPPKGVTMRGVTIPAGENEGKLEIRYANQLPASVRFNLIVQGQMKIGKETLTSITPAILALGPSAKAP